MSALLHRMVNKASQPRLRRWLLLATAAACSLNLAAGEKIEIVGGGVALPERKSLLDERNSFDVLTDKPDLSGGFVVPNIPVPNSATREMLKEADRKKNWIYLNPYEDNKRVTGLEKLEKKGSSNPLEAQQEDQSVLERYLTEKKRRTEETNRLRRDNFGVEEDRSSMGRRYDVFSARDTDRRRDLVDGDDREFARELSLNSFLNPGNVGGTRPDEDRYQKNHFSFGTVGNRPQLSSEERADLQAQEELRAANFQKLLQPRSITPSIAGVIDPIGGQSDPAREAYNPISPSRPGPLDFGRSSSSPSYDTPAFSASSPVRSLPDLDRSSALDDIGARAPQSVISSTPAPTVDRSTPAFGSGFGSGAFSLEVPRRKF